MDGNMRLLSLSIDELIAMFMRDADMAIFTHPDRNCLYKEAEVCRARKLDDLSIIQRQVNRYKQEKFPKGNGLFECTVILRRHTPEVEQFNEMWWDEICKSSKRDQISFPYVLGKSKVKYVSFPHSLRSTFLFEKKGTHLNSPGRAQWG
jgi:hypothetical protein